MGNTETKPESAATHSNDRNVIPMGDEIAVPVVGEDISIPKHERNMGVVAGETGDFAAEKGDFTTASEKGGCGGTRLSRSESNCSASSEVWDNHTDVDTHISVSPLLAPSDRLKRKAKPPEMEGSYDSDSSSDNDYEFGRTGSMHGETSWLIYFSATTCIASTTAHPSIFISHGIPLEILPLLIGFPINHNALPTLHILS